MRLILACRVEPEERDRILTGFDLELSNVQEEPGRAYFEVWLTHQLDNDTVIHYVDDLPIGVRYFVVKAAPIWEERLRQSFPIMAEEEVLDRVRRAGDDQERIEATYMLALIAEGRVREPILAELKASLQHASEKVRHAAVLAVGYAPWPPLLEMLDDLSVKDLSARVRKRATSLRNLIAQSDETSEPRENEEPI